MLCLSLVMLYEGSFVLCIYGGTLNGESQSEESLQSVELSGGHSAYFSVHKPLVGLSCLP